MKPPSVVLTDDGAEIQFDGVSQWRLKWANVRQIAIEITVTRELEYSEAFWKITGPDTDFVAPVELVAGSDEFNARLFSFPGFDRDAYRLARESEARGEAGSFICWRADETRH